MTGRRKRTGSWVALAAAYLMFVQVLLTGAGLGAQAAPVVDSHGAVICHPSALDGAAPGAPDHPGGAAGCCILGCSISAAALPPPTASSLFVPDRRVAGVLASEGDTPPSPSLWRTPRHTRAPPSA